MEKAKSDIISTAAELFKKYGLRSVSIDDVCKELRISKKTFYNYFKQKEQLIERVISYFHTESKKGQKFIWEAFEGENVIDIVMDYDKIFKASLEQNKKYFSLYYDLEKYYPLILQRRLESTRKDREEMVRNFILKGLEEKIFREDINIDLMVEYIASQFHTMLNLPAKKTSDLYQQFRFLKDLLIRILVNEKGMEYYLKNYFDKT